MSKPGNRTCYHLRHSEKEGGGGEVEEKKTVLPPFFPSVGCFVCVLFFSERPALSNDRRGHGGLYMGLALTGEFFAKFARGGTNLLGRWDSCL